MSDYYPIKYLIFIRDDMYGATVFYKHIVPTGLKSIIPIRKILKLTHKDKAKRNPTDELTQNVIMSITYRNDPESRLAT